jgi:hypothetical protein
MQNSQFGYDETKKRMPTAAIKEFDHKGEGHKPVVERSITF